MRKGWVLSFSLLFFLITNAAVIFAENYFVSLAGSDDNPGSISQPFRTVLKGMSVLRAGDVLSIRGGTYTDVIHEPVGLDNSQATSWAQAITIRAYPNESVTLMPSGGERVFTFQRAKQSFIIVEGLNIDARNVERDAIKVTHWNGDLSHHIRIKNCVIKNAPLQGILVVQGEANLTGYNEFIGLDISSGGLKCPNYGLEYRHCHGIYLSGDNNLVEGSLLHNNTGLGVNVNSEKYLIKENVVRNNLIYDNGRYANGVGAQGISISSGSNNQVYGNIVWGNRDGIAVLVDGKNSNIYNNIVYLNNSGTGGGGIPINDDANSTVLQNNTLVNAHYPSSFPSIPGTPPSPPRIIYVSPSGSDSNSGTNAAPFKTIQKAADVVNPGDTVIVRDGIYTRNHWVLLDISRGGSSTAWVTFKSENKWGAILDGQNISTNGIGIGFSPGVSFVRVQGFDVKGFHDAGIDLNPGSGNQYEISGNHVHHNGWFCDATSRTQGIYVGAVNDVLIENNVVHDNRLLVSGENGCTPTSNAFVNQSHGLYIEGSSNLLIKNNIFYDNPQGWAIHVYSGHGQISRDLLIANNTFVRGNPVRDGQIVLTYPGVQNAHIFNNIFYQPTAAGVRISPTDAGVSTFSNILIEKNMTFGGVINSGTASGVTITGNLDNTDPGFISPGQNNFHLAPTSVAIDKGINDISVGDDIDGLKRPLGSTVDLGAFEFDPTPMPPPTPKQVYYVDFDNGNDSNDGLSRNTAWRTIPGTMKSSLTTTSVDDYKSLTYGNVISQSKKVKPGTTFKLKGSTYSITDGGFIWMKNSFYEETASALNPITFERDPDWGVGQVVFEGSGISAPIALIITQVSGIRFDGKGKDGIVIKNSFREGIQAKEKPSLLDPPHVDLSFTDLSFSNNGIGLLTDLDGSGKAQLNIRNANGVVVENVDLDGNNHFINGFLAGNDEMSVKNGLVSHVRAYNHHGDSRDNDAGIGFKAFNSQITFKDCESFQNLKGWDLGEQRGLNTDIEYRVINVHSHDNEWGINFNGPKQLSYSGKIRFYLINSIVRDNNSWGTIAYSGPYELYLVHNVYDNNGNDVFDSGNIRVHPDRPFDNGDSDTAAIQAYVFNNVFHKPNTTKGQNYLNAFVGDASASNYDTNFSILSDYNAWVQKGTEVFARWNGFAGAHRSLATTVDFNYGADGPGHASGKWFTLEDEPGLGTGHAGSDSHSRGTGSSDLSLPPFTNVANDDFTLTKGYSGKNISTLPWYAPEMGIDRAGRVRTTWDMGCFDFSETQNNTDSQAPTIPSNLTGTVVSTSQINLSWGVSTDNVGVVAYRIYRNNGFIPIAMVSGLSYSDTGLSASTIYSYQIESIDLAGNVSARTPAVSFKTKDVELTQIIDSTPDQTTTSKGDEGFLPFKNIINPTKESMTILFDVKEENVTLYIYDRGGVVVRQLQGIKGQSIWDGRNSNGQIVNSGTYLALIKSNGALLKRRLVIVK